MASAEKMRNQFCKWMDRNGKKYTIWDEEDNMIFISFGGDVCDTWVMVDFDEDDDDDCTSVHFNSIFGKCDKSDLPKLYVKLNEINKQYRWAKTWVDPEDRKVTADMDAVIDLDTVGSECWELSVRLSNIIESIVKDTEGLLEVDEETAQMMKLVAVSKRK